MEQKHAIAALAALAQDSRLAVFRLLVRSGPAGLPAGEIAQALGVQPATLSFHLSQLANAGLVESRRDGRSIIYSAEVAVMKELMGFLLHDCCDGHPELCGILETAPAPAACCPPSTSKGNRTS
ncbi:ArsR/SmtB family transcription factor [Azospirillum halopraeferens]|uniref:ArsR/SmtB family transcription factor n=1 Tax=Azospirillum halopraeferens TaxID=34010 RepID=UPI000409EBF8|nr:metalloregulator ArsR/SmtB family transcription factor [Azospirillum halopraeferens]